jgi:hypothetical protein
MAYDRYDQRRPMGWRDDEPRRNRAPRSRDERGFFERAGEEISSWFGDDDRDQPRGRRDEREIGHRERFEGEPPRQHGDRDYRPMTGDYGRTEDEGFARREREPSRRPSMFGPRSEERSRSDPHYDEWRQRQIESLDRDYDEYRRENQSRFENEFSSWREQRQSKRQMLQQAREHMEVVGSDLQPVGSVERIAGDRIILARAEGAAGGTQHSLSCAALDRIEGDRLVLGCTVEQAKKQWRDDNRQRALFEPEDQGEAGPGMLNRSFSGTYES